MNSNIESNETKMYEMLISTMKNGDWGAVARLLREHNQRSNGTAGESSAAPNGAVAPRPIRRKSLNDRFEAVRMTPRKIADQVFEDRGRFGGISIDGVRFKPHQRFLKGMAQRMKVPFSVFELFTPMEVITRAAEKAPDIPLRLTIDHEKNEALAIVEDKGVPMPAGSIESIMHEDKRLRKFDYRDGVIVGEFDLGESWDVPGDSTYGVHIDVEVPVDGMGAPVVTLATWRQVCSNGAIAEAPVFRTKMEIKDNSGAHFKRLLQSFSNPRGVEALHERLIAANETKASVDEVYRVESFIRRQVRDTRHQMLLCERLELVADNPCVRYGVTDISSIGERRRGLLPVGCSVADLMNFVSELGTHHPELLRNDRAAHALAGGFYAKSFDLEEMYPNTQPASGFYLQGIDFEGKAK